MEQVQLAPETAVAQQVKTYSEKIKEYQTFKKKKNDELDFILHSDNEYNKLDVDIENLRAKKADLKKKIISNNSNAQEIVKTIRGYNEDIKCHQLSLSGILEGFSTATGKKEVAGQKIISSYKLK